MALVLLCLLSFKLNVVMLSFANKPLMLSVIYAECRYADCRKKTFMLRVSFMLNIVMLNVIMLIVVKLSVTDKPFYAEYHLC